MLVHQCKYCKKFTIHGYENEFNECFCDKSHYQLYCAQHGYEAHDENLKPVSTETLL